MTTVSEWRERSLGELLDIKHGYAFKGTAFSQGGACRLVTPGNFHERGGFRDRGPNQKSYDGPIPDDYVLPPDSLVVAMTEQAPGLLGSSGLVPRDDNTWLHNQRIGLVLVQDGAANVRFLYYLFNDPSVRAQISASATGTKVRHTAPRRIQAVKARIPDIATQARIAAVLSAFDELIEINERRIELLEDLARALYHEWFVRFQFPGHEDVELVDSDVGPIPKGWEVRQLREIADLRREGVAPSRDPDTTFEHFSIPAFDLSVLPDYEAGASIKSGKHAVVAESVLLSKINPRLCRVWFVKPLSRPSVASTEFLVWTGTRVSNVWLWSFFISDAFREWLIGVAGGTSTSHQRVNPGDIVDHKVAVAPVELFSAFDEFAIPSLQEAHVLRRQNRELAATRDLLLPRLVTGRLDISALDLGELLPAKAA